MKIIGHRGARGLASENTIESIQAAIQSGVDGVEVDARVTSDGIIVLSHDRLLVDDRGNQWVVAQHTYDFLHNRCPALPILQEALTVVPPQLELRIEIKEGEQTEPFVDLLRPLSAKYPKLSVLSFDYRLLKAFHQAAPEVPLLLNEKWSSIRARFRAKRLGTRRIQMNQRWLWRGFLRAIKRGGYHITPYTVNSPAQARRWKPYVEAIITDYPDRFIA